MVGFDPLAIITQHARSHLRLAVDSNATRHASPAWHNAVDSDSESDVTRKGLVPDRMMMIERT
jgi:hypothetical protein